MVACSQCGVHLPGTEAVEAKGRYFCTDEHRRLFQRLNKPAAPELAAFRTQALRAEPREPQAVPDSFWVSLRYFNIYRLRSPRCSSPQRSSSAMPEPRQPRPAALHRRRRGVSRGGGCVPDGAQARAPQFQYPAYRCISARDIVATVLLMYASGGFRSGLGVMLLISLAAASLVSRGRLMLFYAALATIAVLLEQTVEVLAFGESPADFVQPGLLSIGYFATALDHQPARAARDHATSASPRQRGVDLANQLRRSTSCVIQDMQDGVLVVDANGLVRQHNPRVGQLLGTAGAGTRADRGVLGRARPGAGATGARGERTAATPV